jgi:hypothetical protein
MDVISEQELNSIVDGSQLAKKYNQDIDRQSAFELLSGKLEQKVEEAEPEVEEKEEPKEKKGKSTFEEVMNSSVTRTIVREVTRGLLGVLGLKGTSRRKKSSWF